MDFLSHIALVFLLASLVVYILTLLRLPTIMGLLLTGLLVGPTGFGLVKEIEEARMLTEVGLTLLLFTTGVELSLAQYVRRRRIVVMAGIFQFAFTVSGVLALLWIFAKDVLLPKEIVLLSVLSAFSGAAFVLQYFKQKNYLGNNTGRTAMSVLLFQSLVLTLVAILIPYYLGGDELVISSFFAEVVLLIFMIGLGRYLLPFLLDMVARTRNNELFILSVVTISLAAAYVFNQVGVPFALGAFFAGLFISESEHSFEIFNNLLSLRKMFYSLFFVSLAMLVDMRWLFEHAQWVAFGLIGLLAIKITAMLLVGLKLRLPTKSAWHLAAALSQTGSLSLIILFMAYNNTWLGSDAYQLFLNLSVFSLMLSPLMIKLLPFLGLQFNKLPLVNKLDTWLMVKRPSAAANTTDPDIAQPKQNQFQDHVVIIGYGIVGKKLVAVAKQVGISYVVIERNPQTVRRVITQGVNIIYGDASNKYTLQQAHLSQARMVIVAVNDDDAVKLIIQAVNNLHPGVHLLVRSSYLTEVEQLQQLGVNEVIAEEFETVIEIFTRMLHKFGVPEDTMYELVEEERLQTYKKYRSLKPSPYGNPQTNNGQNKVSSSFLSLMHVRQLKVHNQSNWVGKSLKDTNMRQQYGVTLLAIQREGKLFANPNGDTIIQAKDELIVFGKPKHMQKLLNEVALLTIDVDA